MRTCTECGETRDLSRFTVVTRGKYWSKRCKECTNAEKRKKYREDSEFRGKLLLAQRASRYGIPANEIVGMLESQGGLCANSGCRKILEDDWCVDHDHACCPLPASGGGRACGKCVRGILCSLCNMALGSARDNIEVLAGLIKYREGS